MIDSRKKKVIPLRTALDELASAERLVKMMEERDQKNVEGNNEVSSSIESESDSTTNGDYFRLKQQIGNFDLDVTQTPKISKLKPGQKKVLQMVKDPN